MALNMESTSAVQPRTIIEKLKQNITPCTEDPADAEDQILPFVMDYLSPRMLATAKNHLKETEENKEKGLKMLKALIEKEKNLVPRMDENFLLQFLRARKYDVKKAFKVYRNYYSFRKEFEHLYDLNNLNVEKLRAAILRNYFGFLPHRDRFGSAVFIAKIGSWDTEIDGFKDLFQTLSGCVVYANEIPATQVAGYRGIFDLRGMTIKHMKFATPYNLYLIVRSTQYCFPGRYRGVHVITENKFFDVIWTILQPFLSRKLKKRFHFHGNDVSDLKKYIHPSVLPTEFGGQAGTFDNTCWTQVLYEQEDVLKGMLKYGYK